MTALPASPALARQRLGRYPSIMHAAPISLSLALLLAACAVQPPCGSETARELRRVESLIAQSELALARGYKSEPTLRPSIGFGACFGDRGRICLEDRVVQGSRRVAIDPLAERRTLDYLRNRQAALLAQAGRDYRTCTAAAAR